MMNAREVSHDASCVSVMKHPSEGFSKSIGGVEFSRDVRHLDGAVSFPVRDGEVWDSNMSGAFSWCNSINDFLCRLVVFIYDSRGVLWKV